MVGFFEGFQDENTTWILLVVLEGKKREVVPIAPMSHPNSIPPKHAEHAKKNTLHPSVACLSIFLFPCNCNLQQR